MLATVLLSICIVRGLTFCSKVRVACVCAYKVWRDDTNDLEEKAISAWSRGTDRGTTYAVPEPIGRRGQPDTSGTDGQGKDFSNDDPSSGTPCHGEHGNVNADEGDHGRDGCLVVIGGFAGRDTDDADDELRNHHAGTTEHEDLSSSETFDDPEGHWCGENVD